MRQGFLPPPLPDSNEVLPMPPMLSALLLARNRWLPLFVLSELSFPAEGGDQSLPVPAVPAVCFSPTLGPLIFLFCYSCCCCYIFVAALPCGCLPRLHSGSSNENGCCELWICVLNCNLPTAGKAEVYTVTHTGLRPPRD